ncbi:MFS transporter [Kitasatospora sp. NBC_01266]|uniref:MFS transporter n=1 Tax=Kitasatospora sp. NBC_01266 TaxID=2903572 RepID=UPI002E35A692|nr:MFS transporter [Kitasatospora sp. NBC_01266]
MAVSEQEASAPEEWDPLPRPPWAEPQLPPRTVGQRAVLVGTLAALTLVLAIVAGSQGLRDLDAAQLPYAAASVFLAFGLAHRCTVWASGPAVRRFLRLSWRNASCWSGLRAEPLALPRLVGGCLGLRRPAGGRSRLHRSARQLLCWSCLLAAVIAFPLSWGWFTCTGGGDPAGSGYVLRLWGHRLFGFDADGPLGWVVFHGLDLVSVPVVAAAGFLLWRRDGAATGGDGPRPDARWLTALLAVAVTGLLLTFSALALHGGGYQFLAVLHAASVVFTMLYLPFSRPPRALRRPERQTPSTGNGARP